jgi:hypothetical protein
MPGDSKKKPLSSKLTGERLAAVPQAMQAVIRAPFVARSRKSPRRMWIPGPARAPLA